MTKQPWRYLTSVFFTAAVCGLALTQLRVNADIANLLPDDNPHVIALRAFSEKAGGEAGFEVAIQGSSFSEIKSYAEAFAKVLMQDQPLDNPLFQRVDVRNNVRFIEERFLYFLTLEELQYLTDELASSINKAKRDANPFYVELDDNIAPSSSAYTLPDPETFRARMNLPPEYRVNPDSTILLVQLILTGGVSNIAYLERVNLAIDNAHQKLQSKPEFSKIRVIPGANVTEHLEKLSTLKREVGRAGFISILGIILFIGCYLWYLQRHLRWKGGSFWTRTFFPPALLLLPTICSLLITYALALLFFKDLNVLTTALIGIVFGINVDFTLHLYSRYLHQCGLLGHRSAILEVYKHSGRAVFWSGVTTGTALIALVLSDFKGFYEFGVLAGISIIANLFSNLFLITPLLSVFRQTAHPEVITNTKRPLQGVNPEFFLKPLMPLVVGLTLVCIYYLPAISFNYSLSNLDARKKPQSSFYEVTYSIPKPPPAPSYFLLSNKEEAEKVRTELQHRQASGIAKIALIESLSSRIPTTPEEAGIKIALIQKIDSLLKDPFAGQASHPLLNKIQTASAHKTFVPIDSLPPFIRYRITDKTGAPLPLVMIAPVENLSDGRKSMAFKQTAGQVELDNGRTVYAASMQMIAASLLEQLQKEFPFFLTVPLIVAFLAMLLEFRSIRWASVAFLPLITSAILFLGLCVMLGWTFNLYNMLILPIILGVGDDAGIHFTESIRSGTGSSPAELLPSTGLYVGASSLTTVLGFSGLLFIDHRGLESLGATAFLGVFCTVLAALASIPVIRFVKKHEQKRV